MVRALDLDSAVAGSTPCHFAFRYQPRASWCAKPGEKTSKSLMANVAAVSDRTLRSVGREFQTTAQNNTLKRCRGNQFFGFIRRIEFRWHSVDAWASAHRGKWGQLTHLENGWKITKRKHAKRSSFLCLCYILRAIRAGRCRERRYADHIFIQIYFRMHHLVVKFSKFSSPQAARGHWPPNQNPEDVPG